MKPIKNGEFYAGVCCGSCRRQFTIGKQKVCTLCGAEMRKAVAKVIVTEAQYTQPKHWWQRQHEIAPRKLEFEFHRWRDEQPASAAVPTSPVEGEEKKA